MHDLLLVAVAVLVTMTTRFLPFLIFGNGRKTPPLVTALSKVLPGAIMGMLVVYCLKDVQLLTFPHGLPELVGIAVVVGLHVWKRNALFSIGGGTICYMLLVQLVF